MPYCVYVIVWGLIMIITDDNIEQLFSNRIIQVDNFNSNAEIFIYDDTILKVFPNQDDYSKYNLSVVKNLFKKEKYLKKIPELVLPKEFLYYYGKLVGFTMPYVKGKSLQDFLADENVSEDEKYIVFIKILDFIKSLERLPFDFYIGDIHEKNIMVSDYLKINVIDCDSYIIKNKKSKDDLGIRMGKFVNFHFSDEEIDKINIGADYYSLLCLVLNYYLNGMIENYNDPVSTLLDDKQFSMIHDILERTKDIRNFKLTEQDIDRIHNLKGKINYVPREYPELKKEIERVRKIALEKGEL